MRVCEHATVSMRACMYVVCMDVVGFCGQQSPIHPLALPDAKLIDTKEYSI